MAPLPYVLLYWLSGGHALWVTESTANFVCQSLAVLALFAGFRGVLPWPAPLVAAFALALSFVSLPKIMLYDSLAQLFASVSSVLAMHALLTVQDGRRRRVLTSLTGIGCALCFLAKQSTGAGVVAGVLLTVWLSRGTGDWRQRAVTTVRFLSAAGGALVALLVALSPWIDVPGFVTDVVLTSSEAKGGRTVLFAYFLGYGNQLWNRIMTVDVPPLAVAVAFFSYAALATRGPADAVPTRTWKVVPAALGSLLGSALCTFLIVKLGIGYADAALQSVLYIALAWFVAARLRPEPAPAWADALAIFAGITIPAAIGHNLSVNQLRWSYDNDPLIWVPVAFAATSLVQAMPTPLRSSSLVLRAAFVTLLVQSLTSGGFALQWSRAKISNVPWPEVRFLRGARLRPAAEGMRQLVHTVRRLAPAPTDTVMLLPNDPNVESWFERPRPRLSSCNIFADQYWDRYVDRDFMLLHAYPPKVIVVGPRNFWQRFSRLYQPDRATERLGLLIVNKLIPARYGLEASVPIKFADGDFMDVYVLR
jgi:hypothetical protein